MLSFCFLFSSHLMGMADIDVEEAEEIIVLSSEFENNYLEACKEGRAQQLAQLIDSDHPFNTQELRDLALEMATDAKKLSIVQMLVTKGVSDGARNYAFCKAGYAVWLDGLALLSKVGISQQSKESIFGSAKHYTSALEMMRNCQGGERLFYKFAEKYYRAMIIIFQSGFQDPNYVIKLVRNEYAALKIFIQFCQTEYAKQYCIKHKMKAPSVLAKLFEQPEFCSFMQNRQAHNLQRSSCGQTRLTWSILCDDDCLARFLESDMPRYYLNARDNYGNSALHYAILMGNMHLTDLLLRRGSLYPMNGKEKRDITTILDALCYASKNTRYSIAIRLLLFWLLRLADIAYYEHC